MTEHTDNNEPCDRCEGKGLVLAAAPYSTGFRKAHGPWRACPDCAMTEHNHAHKRIRSLAETCPGTHDGKHEACSCQLWSARDIGRMDEARDIANDLRALGLTSDDAKLRGLMGALADRYSTGAHR